MGLAAERTYHGVFALWAEKMAEIDGIQATPVIGGFAARLDQCPEFGAVFGRRVDREQRALGPVRRLRRTDEPSREENSPRPHRLSIYRGNFAPPPRRC